MEKIIKVIIYTIIKLIITALDIVNTALFYAGYALQFPGVIITYIYVRYSDGDEDVIDVVKRRLMEPVSGTIQLIAQSKKMWADWD